MATEATTSLLDDQIAKQRRAFRRMLVRLEIDFSKKNLDRLASCYESTVTDDNRTHIFEDLIGRGCLDYNNKDLIGELVKSLEIIRRVDLIPVVNEYTSKWLKYKYVMPKPSMAVVSPRPNTKNDSEASPDSKPSLTTKNEASSEEDQDENISSSDDQVSDGNQTLITGVVRSGHQESYGYNLRKKRKIDTTGTLYTTELWNDMMDEIEVDDPVSTHDEQDEEFMKMALKEAQNSPDEKVKVGGVIVDRKTNVVLGKGHNRMPRGCEELPWDDNKLTPLQSKYPYVLHGAKAAIFDGLEKGNKLKGAVLYTTLFPANSDAQWIAECGIKEVVYTDNIYKMKLFSEASRKIFKISGIVFRKMALV